MQEEYKKEEIIKDRTEFEKEIELIRNIIKTREELKNNNKKGQIDNENNRQFFEKIRSK